MCFELCGPPLNGDPEEDAAYEAWLDSLTVEDAVEPGDIITEVGEDVTEDDSEEEESKTIHECEALERFDDFLNECWEPVKICGYTYDPARALKQCDEVAYREEFNNWLDSEGLELE